MHAPQVARVIQRLAFALRRASRNQVGASGNLDCRRQRLAARSGPEAHVAVHHRPRVVDLGTLTAPLRRRSEACARFSIRGAAVGRAADPDSAPAQEAVAPGRGSR